MKLPHRRQFRHLATGAAALAAVPRTARAQAYARALWIGPRGREALVRAGLPVALIERCAGVRAIVDIGEDLVLTVEHALGSDGRDRDQGFGAVQGLWRVALEGPGWLVRELGRALQQGAHLFCASRD